jgi:hypothetical protein
MSSLSSIAFPSECNLQVASVFHRVRLAKVRSTLFMVGRWERGHHQRATTIKGPQLLNNRSCYEYSGQPNYHTNIAFGRFRAAAEDLAEDPIHPSAS